MPMKARGQAGLARRAAALVALAFALIGVLAAVPCSATQGSLPLHQRQQHVVPRALDARAASLTVPTVSLSSASVTSGSGSASASGSASVVPTTVTTAVVSTGSAGTTTFTLTTVETTLVSANASASAGANATGTSTAFPSLSTYSTCVVACLDTAVANANCTSLTDLACYCTNATFTQTLFSCVSSNCTSQLSGAESLAQQFCNIESPSVTLSFPSTSGVSTNTTLGSTATLTTVVTSPTSGAMGRYAFSFMRMGSQEVVLGSLLVVALGLLC